MKVCKAHLPLKSYGAISIQLLPMREEDPRYASSTSLEKCEQADNCEWQLSKLNQSGFFIINTRALFKRFGLKSRANAPSRTPEKSQSAAYFLELLTRSHLSSLLVFIRMHIFLRYFFGAGAIETNMDYPCITAL